VECGGRQYVGHRGRTSVTRLGSGRQINSHWQCRVTNHETPGEHTVDSQPSVPPHLPVAVTSDIDISLINGLECIYTVRCPVKT